MLTITRKLEFDAGHRIPDHKSQCRNLHGHRYTLLITLVGAVVEEEGQSDNGMIMDFSDIKALAMTHLVDLWDHAFLVYRDDTAVIEGTGVGCLVEHGLGCVVQGGTFEGCVERGRESQLLGGDAWAMGSERRSPADAGR